MSAVGSIATVTHSARRLGGSRRSRSPPPRRSACPLASTTPPCSAPPTRSRRSMPRSPTRPSCGVQQRVPPAAQGGCPGWPWLHGLRPGSVALAQSDRRHPRSGRQARSRSRTDPRRVRVGSGWVHSGCIAKMLNLASLNNIAYTYLSSVAYLVSAVGLEPTTP